MALADRHSTGDVLTLDGNLSRHLRVLEDAGYVRIDKTFEGRRPRTWVSMTKPGRSAFATEVESLPVLIARVSGQANRAVGQPPPPPAPDIIIHRRERYVAGSTHEGW